MQRNEWLLHGYDLGIARGIEIGALDKPIIPPHSPGVFYVDHATTDELRQKYAGDSSVALEKLVHVNGVWGAQSLAEITAGAGPFDFVVASHVIEHVPDLITWLNELASVLKPEGQVRLVVPDRRYTFDYLRKETEPATVLDAWLRGARVPQAREILDHTLNVCLNDCWTAWTPAFDEKLLKPLYSSDIALSAARQALRDGEYHDVHCWVFTPTSFARLMSQLGRYGVLRFKCGGYQDTQERTYEFLVRLELAKDPNEIVSSWELMHNQLVADAEQAKLLSEQARLEAKELQHAKHSSQLDEQIRELRLQVAAQEASIDAIRNSTSWRVTSPLRWMRRVLAR